MMETNFPSFIPRKISHKLQDLEKSFQVITLTGPRQSGKTTLVREIFTDLPYVSLEEPDIRQFALDDPRGFLSNYPEGAILDEVQHTPELLSYIQSLVDTNRSIKFVLTGSSNFQLTEKINQTLAGRTAVMHLLPLSLEELTASGHRFKDYETAVFFGQYPRIYDRDMAPSDFYPSYIQTYVERDVRSIRNIGDVNAFIQFVRLCAGRTGQLVNYTSLGNDAGISANTVKSWISVLETSYIVYQIQPYHKNFNKRLVKSPKLFFYDTGIVCSLLGIQDATQINQHYMKGALFENLIINELIKQNYNLGVRQLPYFWRDKRGKEIDSLIVRNAETIPLEIKSGRTITTSYFGNIEYWRMLTGETSDVGAVIYGGDESVNTSSGRLISWRDLAQFS